MQNKLTLSLLGGGSSSGGTSSGSGAGSSSSDVSEELGDILTLEGLGEKSWPVAFNGVS